MIEEKVEKKEVPVRIPRVPNVSGAQPSKSVSSGAQSRYKTSVVMICDIAYDLKKSKRFKVEKSPYEGYFIKVFSLTDVQFCKSENRDGTSFGNFTKTNLDACFKKGAIWFDEDFDFELLPFAFY